MVAASAPRGPKSWGWRSTVEHSSITKPAFGLPASSQCGGPSIDKGVLLKKNSAGGARFRTPAWHWALALPENRFLPRRARPVVGKSTRGAFRWLVSIPEGFSLSPAQSYREGTRWEMRRQERRLAQLAPAAVRQPETWAGLNHKFQSPNAVRLHVEHRGKRGRFWLLLTEDGRPLAYGQRQIDFDSRAVEHEYLVFAPGSQGKGHVAQVMANALAVYQRLGVERITLTAGLSAGSAVWPRLGFSPANEEEWTALRQVIRRNVAKLDAAVFASFQTVHGRPLDPALAAILQDDDPLAVFELLDVDPGNQAGKASGLRFGIAGVLLTGGHWRGVLELNGAGGRRLKAYVTGHGAHGPVFEE